MKKNKKIFAAIGSMALSTALCLGVMTGCANSSDNNQAENKTTANDVYATSAVSGAAYLNSVGGGVAYSGFNADGQTDGEQKPTGYLFERITEVKNSIVMFEQIVGSEIKEEVKVNEDKTAYNYDFVMIITVNGEETAKMYYNQTGSRTETELPDDDDEETEVKHTTTLDGVIVYGNGEIKKEYSIHGVQEYETEGNESEFSVEFVTKIDDSNYVEFSYGYENENSGHEAEYEFKIVKDGRTVQETELEFEHKNGRTEVSLTFEHGGTKDAGELKIVRDVNSENVFYVSYEDANGRETNVTVKKTETNYEFTFSGSYGSITVNVGIND